MTNLTNELLREIERYDPMQLECDGMSRVGVQRKWIQHPGTSSEHFDIAKGKRALAVQHGAIRITWRQAGMIQMERDGRLPASHVDEMKRLRKLWADGIDTVDDDEEPPAKLF